MRLQPRVRPAIVMLGDHSSDGLMPGITKNRNLLVIFGVFAVGWIISAAFTGVGTGMPIEPKTQIVVQWMIDATGDISLEQVWMLEDTLEEGSDGHFEVDGHDYGSGTANVFLFSSDPDGAVARIVQLFQSGL